MMTNVQIKLSLYWKYIWGISDNKENPSNMDEEVTWRAVENHFQSQKGHKNNNKHCCSTVFLLQQHSFMDTNIVQGKK